MAKNKIKYKTFKLTLVGKNRTEQRRKIVHKLLTESHGYLKKNGEKKVTRYRYDVERLADGRSIYLKRPTRNAGFDFQVWVEKIDGYKDGKPSYYTKEEKNQKKKPKKYDLLEDLKGKKKKNSQLYSKLLRMIERVGNCEDPKNILTKPRKLDFKKGYSTEMLLKSFKWLFIEQDIRYWNYTGRKMLLKAIKKI